MHGGLPNQEREEISRPADCFSYNKFLAKLASDQRKPNGQFVSTKF